MIRRRDSTSSGDGRAPRGAPLGAVRWVRLVPAPLGALLAVVALFGVSWALVNPPWQGPDEDVHFSYVQTLGEQHRLPGAFNTPLSSAQVDAMRTINNDPIVFFTFAKPEWSQRAYEQWQTRTADLPLDDGGGNSTASGYPPAYYLSVTPAYMVAGSSNVITHLYAARLLSVVWLLVTTTAAWLLMGELFGRRRELQLVGAAAVGLWPMLNFLSASVNPDSMLYATWGLAMWLGTRIIRRGLSVGQAAGLGACVGLAMLTKATSIALVPAGAFVVVLGVTQLLRRRELLQALVTGLAAIGVFVLLVSAWTLVVGAQDRPAYGQVAGVTAGVLDLREFASYIWQYYLPRVPFQNDVHFSNATISDYPAYSVWIATGWAAFGWVTVYFPVWAYWIFLAITVAIGLGALGAGLRWLRPNWRSPVLRSTALPIGVFFALVTGALLLGFHWAEYQARTPLNQGRYLFPLAGLAGALVVAAITWLPDRLRMRAIATVLGSLIVWQLFSLGLVASRYYA